MPMDKDLFARLMRGHRLMEEQVRRDLPNNDETLLTDLTAIVVTILAHSPGQDPNTTSPLLATAGLLGMTAGILYAERRLYESQSESPLQCDRRDPAAPGNDDDPA